MGKYEDFKVKFEKEMHIKNLSYLISSITYHIMEPRCFKGIDIFVNNIKNDNLAKKLVFNYYFCEELILQYRIILNNDILKSKNLNENEKITIKSLNKTMSIIIKDINSGKKLIESYKHEIY